MKFQSILLQCVGKSPLEVTTFLSVIILEENILLYFKYYYHL